MVLKSIKVTAVKRIEKSSQKSGPAHVIGNHSEGSKSSYQSGLEAEKLVQKFYESCGLKLVAHRWRSPFAEVDLVFKNLKSGVIYLVEVKKSAHSDFRNNILSVRQKKRLSRVVYWLSEKGYRVEMRFVIVDEYGEIEEFRDVFG